VDPMSILTVENMKEFRNQFKAYMPNFKKSKRRSGLYVQWN